MQSTVAEERLHWQHNWSCQKFSLAVQKILQVVTMNTLSGMKIYESKVDKIVFLSLHFITSFYQFAVAYFSLPYYPFISNL